MAREAQCAARSAADRSIGDGAVIAAVSVSGPTTRINDHGITRLGDVLVSELRGLSAQLGHHLGKEVSA